MKPEDKAKVQPAQEPVPHPFEDPSVISALAWAAGLIQQEYHAGHNGADSWLMNYADIQGERIRLADHREWEKVHGRWQPITTPPAQPAPVQDSEQFDPKFLDDLKKLMGLPPYNESSNTAMGDGYFSSHLVRTHGKEKFDAAVAYLRNGVTSHPPAQPAVPMTVAQKGAIHAATASMRFYEAVEFAIRKTEAHHGITATPEKGGAV